MVENRIKAVTQNIAMKKKNQNILRQTLASLVYFNAGAAEAAPILMKLTLTVKGIGDTTKYIVNAATEGDKNGNRCNSD